MARLRPLVLLIAAALVAGGCSSPRQAAGTGLIIGGVGLGVVGAAAMQDSGLTDGDAGPYRGVNQGIEEGKQALGLGLLVSGVAMVVAGGLIAAADTDDEPAEVEPPAPLIPDPELCARLDALVAQETDREARVTLLVERTRLCYPERQAQR